MISEKSIFERVVFIELANERAPVPAGLFSLDIDTGVGRFAYGRRYLQRGDSIAVDPVNLPLAEQEYVTRKNSGIFGVLGDLLPDSWGKYILAKRLNIPFGSLQPHEMFDYVTTNAVGALSLGLTPDQPFTRQEAPIAFNELHKVAEAFVRAMSDEDLPAEVLYLLEQGTSLGGAQPKCPVIYNNSEWIAKFENARTPVNFPRIEFASMQLAELAGITVPEIRLEEISGSPVYLIKRFDRHEGRRVPFMSGQALSDLDLEELEKGSYLEMARQMRKFVKNVNRDLSELFRRMVFNVLIRNQDDHLRNHGFICLDQAWRLSPLYDVLPIPARRTADNFSLSLNIGLEGTTATLSNIYSRCEQFNLARGQAEEIVAEVAEATAGWEEMLLRCGVEKTDIEAVRWCFEGFREAAGFQ
ncbi:MAG: type II toxin-antitoxin system HipA family toxin [Proteobacteria bacterium]|nr:type II toxin-antitoxin system HipA family toxin [Pseudomonadota bacterium]MBU1739771.1 type II toxin-antitoxin system HipA family toxin [Pseudomonadota bacterium]